MTTLLQLGQSFFSFHGFLCQLPLLLPPTLRLPPPLPAPSPPPPPLESAAMSVAFCAMTSATSTSSLRCSASLVYRSVTGSKAGGTGVRVVVSEVSSPKLTQVIPPGSRCRGRK